MVKKLLTLATALLLTSCLHNQVDTKTIVKTSGELHKSFAGKITSVKETDAGVLVDLQSVKGQKTVPVLVAKRNLRGAKGNFDFSQLAVGNMLKVVGHASKSAPDSRLTAHHALAFVPLKFKDVEATTEEKLQCQKLGGKVVPAGMRQADHCEYKLPDGGQVCSNHSDCLGECLLPDSVKGLQHGEATKGLCAKSNLPYGCRALVNDGVFEGTLCVD